jgi:hypothetical protein
MIQHVVFSKLVVVLRGTFHTVVALPRLWVKQNIMNRLSNQ